MQKVSLSTISVHHILGDLSCSPFHLQNILSGQCDPRLHRKYIRGQQHQLIFRFPMVISADGWYNYHTKKSLKPHGLSDFFFRGVFLQPLFASKLFTTAPFYNLVGNNDFGGSQFGILGMVYNLGGGFHTQLDGINIYRCDWW